MRRATTGAAGAEGPQAAGARGAAGEPARPAQPGKPAQPAKPVQPAKPERKGDHRPTGNPRRRKAPRDRRARPVPLVTAGAPGVQGASRHTGHTGCGGSARREGRPGIAGPQGDLATGTPRGDTGRRATGRRTQGAPGLPGIQGQLGPQGPAGLTAVTVVQSAVVGPTTGSKEATATCADWSADQRWIRHQRHHQLDQRRAGPATLEPDGPSSRTRRRTATPRCRRTWSARPSPLPDHIQQHKLRRDPGLRPGPFASGESAAGGWSSVRPTFSMVAA